MNDTKHPSPAHLDPAISGPWDRPFPEQATEDDVFHCFRLLLGRPPSREEWTGHAAHIGRPLESVVAGYAGSLEFARRPFRRATEGQPTIAQPGEWRMFADQADEAVGRHVHFGRYEPEVEAVFRAILRPGMAMLDVGGNIGFFALLACHLVGPTGRVVAVEPNPRNVRMIEASRVLNRFDQLTVVQAAAAERTGLKVLHTFGSNGTTSEPGGDPARLIEADTVGCVRLDDILPGLLDGRPVDFIKIDVEGAEYLALRGLEAMLRAARPAIVTEFSPDQMPGISGVSGAEYLGWLASLGYSFAVLRRDGPPEPVGTDAARIVAEVGRLALDHIDLLARHDPSGPTGSMPGSQ